MAVTRRSRALALGGVVLLLAVAFAIWHDGDQRPAAGSAPPDAAARATCSSLVSELPSTVAGQGSVELDGGDGWAMAWGDPAIVLRCGVAEPAALTATSQCLTVNDIDWFATEDGKAADPSQRPETTVDFTTVGRSVNVEVSVPAQWSPASDALVDVSAAVSGATTETRPCR